MSPEPPRPHTSKGSGALFVALGIFSSRIVGLVRERVLAHYFGTSLVADAFKAAQGIPNFLQNLLGEGVLSASFIPVYAHSVAAGDREGAERVAGAVFGLLGLVVGVLVAAGVLGAPWLVDVLVPGFEGETRALTVVLVRIAFPGIGVLVFSAWCLGILNSHRRFFLSYVAPVVWNLVQIAALVVFGGRRDAESLAKVLSWATVIGAVLQFAIQLPSTLSLLGKLRPNLSLADEGVRRVLKSFGPVVLGRGVVQVSSQVDRAIASGISASFAGAFAILDYAQRLYLIPVSIFGMSVSAAELPAMSSATGSADEIHRKIGDRLATGIARIAFFVVPSASAFLFLGDVVAGAVLQTGQFGAESTRLVWYTLMGSAVGLVASTMGRLYASALYALKLPRLPLRAAIVRVVVSGTLGLSLALWLPRAAGLPAQLGTSGITLASGFAAWLEFLLLRRQVERIVGATPAPSFFLAKLWGAALVSAGIAVFVKWALGEWAGRAHTAPFAPPSLHPVVTAVLVLAPYGIAYFGLTSALGISQSVQILRRLRGRR